MPILLQMLIYNNCIIYIGYAESMNLVVKIEDEEGKDGEKKDKDAEEEEEEEENAFMTMKDAMMFPVFGSCALCTLYVAYKFLGPEWVNFLLCCYLTFGGWAACSFVSFSAFKNFVPREGNAVVDWFRWNVNMSVMDLYLQRLEKFLCLTLPCVFGEEKKEKDDGDDKNKDNEKKDEESKTALQTVGGYINSAAGFITSFLPEDEKKETKNDKSSKESKDSDSKPAKDVILHLDAIWAAAIVFGAFVSLGFLMDRKCWVLHNLLGVCLSIAAIKQVSLNSFKIAYVMLAGLFFYDIFWVFGTEVMVTVAKQFDGPAKLIFPVSFDPYKQSILGLGDICIPGFFLAMCMRFDYFISKQGQKPQGDFARPYFYSCLAAYCVGLCITVGVMFFFQAAQPALLYLCPACIIASSGMAFYRNELPLLWSYEESELYEKKDEDVVIVEKEEDKKEQ
jgi:hypothetical protein